MSAPRLRRGQLGSRPPRSRAPRLSRRLREGVQRRLGVLQHRDQRPQQKARALNRSLAWHGPHGVHAGPRDGGDGGAARRSAAAGGAAAAVRASASTANRVDAACWSGDRMFPPRRSSCSAILGRGRMRRWRCPQGQIGWRTGNAVAAQRISARRCRSAASPGDDGLRRPHGKVVGGVPATATVSGMRVHAPPLTLNSPP